MDIFVITYKVTEVWEHCEDKENKIRCRSHILGYFTDSKLAMCYLMKHYDADPTNGCKNVEVIDEYMQTLTHKNGHYYGKVKKIYKCHRPEITYTEEMEIKKVEELNGDSDPNDAILKTICG